MYDSYYMVHVLYMVTCDGVSCDGMSGMSGVNNLMAYFIYMLWYVMSVIWCMDINELIK